MNLLLRGFLLLSLTSIALFSATASDFQQPTREELSMTSDPAAPGSDAVYLFRQETSDDKLHFHSLYARIKILTEKGKKYADVEIPYEGRTFTIRAVEGRTIHPDGTAIPFTGKPIDKLLFKSGDRRIMSKVFSLPDVQVGSIIEYRYVLAYEDNIASSPQWYIQQPLFVHKAHYHFNPTTHELVSNSEHGNVVNRLLYTQVLPPGAKVRDGLDGFDLEVENIPAISDEEYMPPMRSVSYRVLFYYTAAYSGDDYWKEMGKYWSKDVNRFAAPSAKMQQAVQQIVSSGGTEEEKLKKIYAAVMQLENTSFTRERTAAENKALGLKIKTADDIWEQKRGNEDELTRLFIAMVRAAGMKAYDMIVTNRDRDLFVKSYLDWDQLDDEIAIVPVNGKEMFFDPGQRYCEFGKLHWKHTMVQGIRQTDSGTEITNTPSPTYKDTVVSRFADLTVDAEGKVSGVIRINYTGSDALYWRQFALRNDEMETKKAFEDALQRTMPPGIVVKTNHFIGLADYNTVLMALVDVSGGMGTATGKRIFLPGTFFEAGAKPLFAHEKRESPVDLHYPYMVTDQVKLTLPAGMVIENTPKDTEIPLPKFADYVAKYKGSTNSYNYGRLLVMANIFYEAKEYPDLRGFYAKVNAQDQQQIVLHMEAAATKEQ
ncbi:MAG TPA: DUF3857 domain-containing protein [Pseudacidobacterium sp.]|nr:DUF3857 domain-containing protein [Pseudacidobacterium sp.]